MKATLKASLRVTAGNGLIAALPRRDRLHLIESPEAEDGLALHGHAPADETGVTPLRHERDAVVVAPANYRRDLIHRAGPHNGGCRTLESSGPVDGGAEGGVTLEDMGLTDDAHKGLAPLGPQCRCAHMRRIREG